jgi:hypothetical protein
MTLFAYECRLFQCVVVYSMRMSPDHCLTHRDLIFFGILFKEFLLPEEDCLGKCQKRQLLAAALSTRHRSTGAVLGTLRPVVVRFCCSERPLPFQTS